MPEPRFHTYPHDTMETRKLKVLFVCVHNSARSQMAEAWLNHLCPDLATATSAGLEPGTLNPLAVEAMREVGVDISGSPTKSVLDLFKVGHKYDRVISVCDQKSAERCPLFPGLTVRLHWSFEDPSKAEGTQEQKLAKMREVRDAIRKAIEDWSGAERSALQSVG